MITKTEEFNWDIYVDGYTGNNKLTPNLNIKGTDNNLKCFSREPYAQKLFDIYSGHTTSIVKKDLIKGDSVLITDIINIFDNKMDIEISGGLSIHIDLNREKKFLQIFGFSNPEDFVDKLQSRLYVEQLLSQNLLVYVMESSPNIKVSLWQGYLSNIKNEFMNEIKNPSQAYTAKIIEANKGGFFVEVQGLNAFMPGSLAAANKISNFQSYVGKEVIVMIEDFLTDMNSFIVSHKKYIAYILPQKLSEIDTMSTYSGTVTGASKYGLFIEFGEFFTGLLHVSKMSEETKKIFQARNYNPGDKIDFYVSEVTKDKRIILTEENPVEKLEKIQKFILNSQDKVLKSEIVAIMKFGIIVTIGDITGLIPLSEFKRRKMFTNNFLIKDEISVVFNEFKNDKLVFSLPKA